MLAPKAILPNPVFDPHNPLIPLGQGMDSARNSEIAGAYLDRRSLELTHQHYEHRVAMPAEAVSEGIAAPLLFDRST